GRVWFLSSHHLLSFDHSKWSAYPLPQGAEPWLTFTDGLAALRDGTLAIGATSPRLLIFDPANQSFHWVTHPLGRTTRTFAVRADGTLLVETFAPGSSLR